MSEVKRALKLIVMDVDGTLTDGMINIGENGEVFKSFYCRDGLGILRAIEAGLVPVILTSRISEIVNRRAAELGITHIYQGFKQNKAEKLTALLLEMGVDATQVAYIGDDMNDLACMHLCGISGCPADAVDDIKAVADFISKKDGGHGAVREFIEFLL